MKLVDIQKILSLPVDYSDRQDRLYRLVFPMFLALGYNPYDKRAFVIKENLDIAIYKGVQVVLRVVLKDHDKVNLGSGLTCITDGKVYNIYLGKKLRCQFNAEKATEEDFQKFQSKLGYDNIEAYWDKAELEVVYGDQINYVGDFNFKNNVPKKSNSLIDKSSKVNHNVELVLDNISKFDASDKTKVKSNKNNKDPNSIDAVDHLIIYQILKIVQQQTESLNSLGEKLIEIENELNKINKSKDTEKEIKEATKQVENTEISIDAVIDEPIKKENRELAENADDVEISIDAVIDEPIKKQQRQANIVEKPAAKTDEDEKTALDYSKEYIYNTVDVKGHKLEYIKIRGEVLSKKAGTKRAIAALIEYVLDNNLCTANELINKVKILHLTSGERYRKSTYVDKYNIEITRIRHYDDFKRIVSKIVAIAGMSDSDIVVKFLEQA